MCHDCERSARRGFLCRETFVAKRVRCEAVVTGRDFAPPLELSCLHRACRQLHWVGAVHHLTSILYPITLGTLRASRAPRAVAKKARDVDQVLSFGTFTLGLPYRCLTSRVIAKGIIYWSGYCQDRGFSGWMWPRVPGCQTGWRCTGGDAARLGHPEATRIFRSSYPCHTELASSAS